MSILHVALPEAFKVREEDAFRREVLATQAVSQSVFEVTLVDSISKSFFQLSVAIEDSIFDHASVDEVLCLDQTKAIKFSVEELTSKKLLGRVLNEELAIAVDLTIGPHANVLLSFADEGLLSKACLVPSLELSFKEVAGAVADLELSMHLIIIPAANIHVSIKGDELSLAMLLPPVIGKPFVDGSVGKVNDLPAIFVHVLVGEPRVERETTDLLLVLGRSLDQVAEVCSDLVKEVD